MHLDAVKPKLRGYRGEQIGPLSQRFNKVYLHVRPHAGDDEAGKPSAAADIDQDVQRNVALDDRQQLQRLSEVPERRVVRRDRRDLDAGGGGLDQRPVFLELREPPFRWPEAGEERRKSRPGMR